MLLIKMSKEYSIIEISEYRTIPVDDDDIDEDDWNYLETKFGFNKDKHKPKIYINKIGKIKKIVIENTSYAGIIQLKKVRLYFSTKVKTHLFYILNSLKSRYEKDKKVKTFIFDPESPIEMKEGFNFYEVIARLFLNELEDIMKNGPLRKFNKRHCDRDFIIGKLDTKEQIKKDIYNNFKFSCVHNNLTANNRENQIVLSALRHLIYKVRYNKRVIVDLKYYEHLLKIKGVGPTNVSVDDCNKIHFNEINNHYFDIIQFSKIILDENFIKSVHYGGSIGFNFIVNMIYACQDFFETRTKNVIKNHFREYKAVPQDTIPSVIERSNERPDLIMKDMSTNISLFPFNFKYKIKDVGDDYRHIALACLAMPGATAGILFYPWTGKDIEKIKFIRKDITTRSGKKIPILVYYIDLYMDDNIDYGGYIKNIEDQIEDIISHILIYDL